MRLPPLTAPDFLLSQHLPTEPQLCNLVQFYAKDSFIQDQLVCNDPNAKLSPAAPSSSSSRFWSPMSCTKSTNMTWTNQRTPQARERALQEYYFMGMDHDFANHLCHCCQCRPSCRSVQFCPDLNSDLRNITKHNQQIQGDLFGPICTAENGDSFILHLTNAYTWCTQLASLPDDALQKPLPTPNLTTGSAYSEPPSRWH